MIRSKRALEGYLLIDHRNAPASPDVPAGMIFEAPTITCSHCEAIVIINPDRTRERARCWSCDHYICDRCAAVPYCTPWSKVMDDVERDVMRQQSAARAEAVPLLLTSRST